MKDDDTTAAPGTFPGLWSYTKTTGMSLRDYFAAAALTGLALRGKNAPMAGTEVRAAPRRAAEGGRDGER